MAVRVRGIAEAAAGVTWPYSSEHDGSGAAVHSRLRDRFLRAGYKNLEQHNGSFPVCLCEVGASRLADTWMGGHRGSSAFSSCVWRSANANRVGRERWE